MTKKEEGLRIDFKILRGGRKDAPKLPHDG